MQIDLGSEKSRELKKYAKLQIIKYCNIYLSKVIKLLEKTSALITMRDKCDIENIINMCNNGMQCSVRSEV